MFTYIEMLRQYANDLEVECIVSIDDKTMQKRYSIYSNLHMAAGICAGELFKHMHTTSKREYNKEVQRIKQATGRKFKLSRTNNSLGYTRLIYTLQGSKQCTLSNE